MKITDKQRLDHIERETYRETYDHWHPGLVAAKAFRIAPCLEKPRFKTLRRAIDAAIRAAAKGRRKP